MIDNELIRQIAEAIVNEAIFSNWAVYVLITALALVSGALGSLIGAYFSKRGEHKAIKADFDEIKKQLADTTELTHQIADKFSNKAQHRQLMREKLETAFQTTYELEDWLMALRDSAILGNNIVSTKCPLGKIVLITRLYLPDAECHADEIRMSVIKYRIACSSYATKRIDKDHFFREQHEIISEFQGKAELFRTHLAESASKYSLDTP